MHFTRTQNGKDQAGKAGAAAEIEPGLHAGGREGKKLRRIENVPAPEILERRTADQIDGGLPALEQRGIGFETR